MSVFAFPSYTSLSSFLSLVPISQLSSNDRASLVHATRDRAVLLLEIHDYVLRHHLKMSQEVMNIIVDLQVRIADACPEEAVCPKRFAYRLAPGRNFRDRVFNARPPNMTWLTWMATGSPMTAAFLADALCFVHDERKHVQAIRDKGHKVALYSDRCASSGMTELRPAVNMDKGSDQFKLPRDRMKPRDRIASLRYVQPSEDVLAARAAVQWEYRGVLEHEARLRLQLATIPGSWTCVRSGLNSYDEYMAIQQPHLAHFPVRFGTFGAFLLSI